jgi:hypothetical protein
MKNIERHNILAENAIRAYVRNRIDEIVTKNNRIEEVVRNLVRKVINEADSDVAPHESTGINTLEDVLKKIIPILEQAYKRLTSKPEQRQSFRNHIVQAVKNTIKRGEALPGGVALENTLYEVDPDLFEDIVVNLAPDEEGEEESVSGDFIDIEGEEELDTFSIAGEDETGRNFAEEAFDKVEKVILDSYTMLSDQKDQELYYDYLLTNLMLYFDKFEDDLATELPQITTPEYEKAKEEPAEEEPPAEEEEAEEEPAEEEPLI